MSLFCEAGLSQICLYRQTCSIEKLRDCSWSTKRNPCCFSCSPAQIVKQKENGIQQFQTIEYANCHMNFIYEHQLARVTDVLEKMEMCLYI